MSSTGPRFRTPADVRAIPNEQIDEWVRAGTLPLHEFGPECELVLGAVVRSARRRMGLPPGARRLDVRATRAAFAAGTLGTVGDHPAGEDAERDAVARNADRHNPDDVQHEAKHGRSEAERQAWLRRVQHVDPRERRA